MAYPFLNFSLWVTCVPLRFYKWCGFSLRFNFQIADIYLIYVCILNTHHSSNNPENSEILLFSFEDGETESEGMPRNHTTRRQENWNSISPPWCRTVPFTTCSLYLFLQAEFIKHYQQQLLFKEHLETKCRVPRPGEILTSTEACGLPLMSAAPWSGDSQVDS